MVDAVKEFLPNTEDFIAADQYAELHPIIQKLIRESKDKGFKDAVIASALVQAAIDHLDANDPAMIYDWSMAHMKRLQEEHVKWFDRPKKLVPRRNKYFGSTTH